MAEILSGSIDLSKIDKSKITEKTLKDGTIGKFININVTINNEVDPYGNIAGLTISQTQEERTAKTKKVYLGNLKRVWSDNVPTLEQPKNNSNEDNKDDLPF
jgi:hypothetical protein